MRGNERARRRWWLSGPARALRALFFRLVVVPLTRFIASPLKVEGLENLGGLNGPVIVAPNHVSHADGPLVVAALPPALQHRLIAAAAADVMFVNPLASFAAALLAGAIPIERKGSARSSLRRAIEVLREGWWLLLFPEGRCSPDGRLGPFKAGIGLLAKTTGAVVVPVGIQGSGEILPPGRLWPRRARATVTFGPPLHYSHASWEAFALDLRKRIEQCSGQETLPNQAAPLPNC